MNVAVAATWPPVFLRSTPPADTLATLTSVADEVITPEQFFAPADRSGGAWTPERRLLLAVLEDAVAMFLRYRSDSSTRGKRLFRETQAWFASTERTSLCAFESICDHLNLNADYLRLGLRRLREPQPETPPSRHDSLRQPWRGNRHLTIVAGANRS